MGRLSRLYFRALSNCEVFRYYGKSYGWQLWFQRSRKTLVSLYPQHGGFVVQIVLGPTLLDAASQLPLGTNVSRTLEEAQQYPEGKWLFIAVSSNKDIEDVKKLLLLVFAFAGWALCGATMGIGMAVTTEGNALIIHAAAAPIFFGILSWIYHRRFNYTTPLQTAAIFVGFVIAVDFFVVAFLIQNSFEMFENPLGTWIPFALIFLASYLAGRYAQKRINLQEARKCS